jgi:hypothetical protein
MPLLNTDIHHWKRQLLSLITILTKRKPYALSWSDYIAIRLLPIRYQPLVFPDGVVIENKASGSVMDSRDKLRTLGIPEDLTDKSFMDIGCAEGFFVREAAQRNARIARGSDINAARIKLAQRVTNTWPFKDRVKYQVAPLYEITTDWTSDIVTCLAVCHHLHGGNHDTWQIISDPEPHQYAFQNLLKAVQAVADLTNEMTIWEYCYEYSSEKPVDVDFHRLGEIWVNQGIYSTVEFKGIAQEIPGKDRVIYHARK